MLASRKNIIDTIWGLDKFCLFLFFIICNFSAKAQKIDFSDVFNGDVSVSIPAVIAQKSGYQINRKVRNFDPGNCNNKQTYDNYNTNNLRYESFTFLPCYDGCVDITVNSIDLMPVIYSFSYDPQDPARNFYKYGGSSGKQSFSFEVKGGETYVLVLVELSTGQGNNQPYTVTINNLNWASYVSTYSTLCSGMYPLKFEMENYEDATKGWQESNNGTEWTTLTNTSAVASTYNFTTNKYFRATLHQPDCAGNFYSQPAFVVVNPTPIVTLSNFDEQCTSSNSFELTHGTPEGGIYSGQGVVESSDIYSFSVCIFDALGGNCMFTNSLCNDGYNDIVGGTKLNSVSIYKQDVFEIDRIEYKLYFSSGTGNNQQFNLLLNNQIIGSYSNTTLGGECNPTTYPQTIVIQNDNLTQLWNRENNNFFSVQINNSRAYIAGYSAVVYYRKAAFSPSIAGAGIHKITYSFQSDKGCKGNTLSNSITVGPPKLVAASDIEICSGQYVNVAAFSFDPPNVTYSWSNDNTAIGLAASGIGNIGTFLAANNNTNLDIIANISVTPVWNCTPNPQTFKIVLRPLPDITSLLTMNICSDSKFTFTPTSSFSTCKFWWKTQPDSDWFESDTLKQDFTNNNFPDTSFHYSIKSRLGTCFSKVYVLTTNFVSSNHAGSILQPKMLCINEEQTLFREGRSEIISWFAKAKNETLWNEISTTANYLDTKSLQISTDYKVKVKYGYCYLFTKPARVCIDTVFPTINSKAKYSLGTNSGACKHTWNVENFDVTYADNCAILKTSVMKNNEVVNTENMVLNIGIYSFSWLAIDSNSNISSFDFLLNIVDNQKPEITCPSNITKQTDAEKCSATLIVPIAEAKDNCGINITKNNLPNNDRANEFTFPLGTTTIIYAAIDIYGNSNTCAMQVKIEDKVAPTVSGIRDTTICIDSNIGNIILENNVLKVKDNCPVSLTQITGIFNNIYPVGTHVNKFAAKDSSGNTTIFEQKIIIKNESVTPENITIIPDTYCEGSIAEILLKYEKGSKGSDAQFIWADDSNFSHIVGYGDELYLHAPTSNLTFFGKFQGFCNTSQPISKKLTIFSKPFIQLGNDLEINRGESIQITEISTNGKKILWFPANSVKDSMSFNPIVSPEVSTLYKAVVTDENSCMASDELFVKVNPAIEFHVFNAFSPNNDGENDFFIVDHIEDFPEAEIKIFNRNGLLVFSKKGYKNDWNGTFKNTELPVGTYYYLINPNNGTKEQKGSITIVR